MHVLVVDGDSGFLEDMALRAGSTFLVTPVHDGWSALQRLGRCPVDLVVVGSDLPDVSPSALLSSMRRIDDQTPVIVLSSDESPDAELKALRAGADGFLARSRGTRVLAEHLQVWARRRWTRERELRVGPLIVNEENAEATVLGHPVNLRRREFELLSLLVRHADNLVTVDTIRRSLWAEEDTPTKNAVTQHVARLRKALRGTPVEGAIISRPGRGYSFSLTDLVASQQAPHEPAAQPQASELRTRPGYGGAQTFAALR